ncbi:MAG: methionine aminopeptidase [Dehalococcoides mccartyi]
MTIILKTEKEIAIMRRAGHILAAALEEVKKNVRPGVTTRELDEIAERELRRRGTTPSFKGYQGFPASLCASVNEEIVHGIPGGRVLKEGDIISLDIGNILEGFQADMAVTVGVGEISPAAARLLSATQASLVAGIAQARAGGHLGDIGAVVEEYAQSRGYGVVRDYTGHGIGRDMHEDPQIPNFGRRGKGPELKKGMTLAIEPMLNLGTEKTRVAPDCWTVYTADGSLSAHFEHTVAITDGEPEILTVIEG